MNRVIALIIGIVIFILVVCASYIEMDASSKKEDKNTTNNTNTTEETTQEKSDKIVYKGKFPMPVENFITVTSKFGYRDGHGVVHNNHTGIDLCGSLGSNVMAVRDGEVTHAGWQGGYGNCVEIKHTSDEGATFYTFYAHMMDNSLRVTKGQQVTLGQIIGTQGSTGNSTGPHLHFEVRTNSGSNKYAIDPAPYLFDEK